MSTDGEYQKRRLWTTITTAIVLGILGIIFIGTWVSDIKGFFAPFGSALLIAGASLSTGGFIGFLFGIPSIMQDPTAKLKYNDNLVQISDWLTKIIVGVGLTQLTNIPHKILIIGYIFKDSFGYGFAGRNMAIAVMSYFFVLGFLIMYFWSRTDYSQIMKDIDDDINKKLKETEIQLGKTEDRLKVEIDKKEKAETIVNETKQKVTQSSITKSEFAGDVNHFEQLKNNSDSTIQEKLEALSKLVGDLLATKTITLPEDLQKNRWGGKAENNGKTIRVIVKKNDWQNLFDIRIEILTTDGSPLTEPVAVFIHDSYQFTNDLIYLIPDNTTGIASLSMLGEKAFTVGVLFPDKTELEFDMNNQTGYPEGFYWKKE